MAKIDLRLGDCLEVLKTIPDNSVDSIVTDPPYGLSFMNKKWDYDVPSVDVWRECIRVLKPGGHLLSFAGSRTYHRMAVRIEDAGFEIRDQIMWVYGSGFPKSHNIGKAIDKRGGESIGWFGDWLKEWREENNIPQSKIAELFPSKSGGLTGCVSNWELGNNLPTNEQFNLICETFDLPFKSLEEAEREYIGTKTSGIGKAFTKDGWGSGHDEVEITKGNSEWEGWGTALKPAHEPIVMARKPLSEKSIAENVLKHGTGGINIDGSRIEIKEGDGTSAGHRTCNIFEEVKVSGGNGSPDYETHELGRFPANIIFDEEAGQLLDEQSGISKSNVRKGTTNKKETYNQVAYGKRDDIDTIRGHNDKGGASRFFYCPKAAKKDRNEGLDGRVEIFTPTIKLVYLLKNNIWEKLDLKAKPLVDTDISQIKDTDEFIITGDYKWNTASFGNYIMEQFLKDGKSITETEINSTTIYQTLNSSIQKYTRTYIAELYGEMVSDIKFVSDAEQKSTTLNITLQNKDGYSQNVKNVELKGLWSINIVPSKSGHATVKPTDLMRYLINLITPPNGVVLDPFMGSGSTGKAAIRCGVNFIGIEKEEEYMKIAEARINHEKNKPVQTKLL